jgi:putative ABC transport system substrate-binding protein
MRELGYVEGRNLVLEPRFADGQFERLPVLAQELVRLNPDVIFVSTTPGSLAAKAATATIPIVFVAVAELTGKRLELLKEIVRVFYDVTHEAVEVLAIVTKAEAARWLAEYGTPGSPSSTG